MVARNFVLAVHKHLFGRPSNMQITNQENLDTSVVKTISYNWQANENNLAKHAINVHKFGGSSLASVECINRVVEIIQNHCQLSDVIVVSANGDTTDHLIELLSLAANKEQVASEQITQALNALQAQQHALITGLLPKPATELLFKQLDNDIAHLTQWLVGDLAETTNHILALGELWSARLLSAILNDRVCPSYSLDAREFLVIENEQNCTVEYSVSSNNLRQLQQANKLVVITGYIANDLQGQACTLGRNGSDYSATIVAALTKAKNVTLWTDVDGIYSADPRIVPSARKLHRVPRGVAIELGRLGNPVLHAKTLQPLAKAGSHLHVASSFDPVTAGTEVGDFGQIAKQELSVTVLNDVLLAQSTSLVAERGQQAFQEFNAISADFSQGHIVIPLSEQKALSEWLAGDDSEVKFTPVSLIAVVGHKVSQRGNVKVRFKRALKQQNPIALLSAPHEHSLVAVLPHTCTTEVLNNVHHDLTKNARHIGLVIAGLGNIGQRFIELLPAQLAKVSALETLHLVGLISSKQSLINADGIEPEQALVQFEKHSQPYEQAELLNWLAQHPYDDLIVVDITPSEAFSQLYGEFFARGIHVIGANKWAGSSATEDYNQLIQLTKQHDSVWLGNTTVGAGLPINHAIADVLQSGDSIEEISGIFSGTLSWLFENFDGSQPFSQLLKQALADGLTEPDPREDLSGRDVQRKLLILARLAGFELSLEDIACENLVPESLQSLTTAEFLQQAQQLDQPFAQALSEAKQAQQCIRYIARFSANKGKITAKVSLESLALNDPFAQLTPCDNIFKIASGWYQENPLIIRGPGAGRDVTAGGLHSDLVNACKQLATRQHQVKLKGIS